MIFRAVQNRIFRHNRVFARLSFALVFFSAAAIFAAHFSVKTYTVADGLLRDTVYKIKQDSRGFLWFCTDEGISRFDGFNFTNLTVADGLPAATVNDFLETSKGDYLLATDGGLVKLNPNGVRGSLDNPLLTVYLPAKPNAHKIEVLLEDESGEIWAGTGGGLYKISENFQFENVPLGLNQPENIEVFALLKDRRGVLWVGTFGGGLIRLAPDGKTERFTVADGLPGNNIASLLEDRDGRLWAGMRSETTGGLVLLNPSPDAKTPVAARIFTGADGIPSDWIPSMLNTSDGKFWLGTTLGLCLWQSDGEKSVCQNFTKENDLCDKDVWSLAEDKDGNLWTGSRCGAKKINRYGFMSYGEKDGIGETLANSIFENSAGDLFATVTDNGTRNIYRFDGGKFTRAAPHIPEVKQNYGWGWKQTVWQDSAGAWLIPTGFGLYKYPAQTKFENLGSATAKIFSPATKNAEVFRVYEDLRSDIWISTVGGELWRWSRTTNTWQDLTEQIQPAPNLLVSAFVEDKSGNLWIGTGGGEGGKLIRYRNGEFKIFTANDGLPNGFLRDLFVDRTGRLWLANTKNGVFRIDDVNADSLALKNYSTAEGLASATAYCLTEDAFGRIYIGSSRGIDRLNPDTGQIDNFTTADGLASSDVEIAYRDRQNNLWFGTANGLTKYVPEPERNRYPPTILLTGLRINGEPQAVSILGERQIPRIELNADQRQISIDFLGLGASPGEPLKYEYRLGESDWTRTNERTVNFANLSGGNYRLEIRAVTADRILSLPAAVSFRIAAPIYLRPWFLLASALLFGGLAFSVYRYRVSRLLELERMRTRIATDLHDDIGANLTKISILSEVAHRKLSDGAHDYDDAQLLENIAETSRESVSAMSDIVWAINPKKDSLADLTRRMRRYAEEILEQRGISLQFDSTVAELRLDANVRRSVYLIFKESINNIVRHSRAEVVRVNFRIEQNTLSLTIADDGAGFETAAETDGNGLSSIKKRADELKGKLEIKSELTKGTTIILQVDLSRNFRTRAGLSVWNRS